MICEGVGFSLIGLFCLFLWVFLRVRNECGCSYWHLGRVQATIYSDFYLSIFIKERSFSYCLRLSRLMKLHVPSNCEVHCHVLARMFHLTKMAVKPRTLFVPSILVEIDEILFRPWSQEHLFQVFWLKLMKFYWGLEARNFRSKYFGWNWWNSF